MKKVFCLVLFFGALLFLAEAVLANPDLELVGFSYTEESSFASYSTPRSIIEKRIEDGVMTIKVAIGMINIYPGFRGEIKEIGQDVIDLKFIGSGSRYSDKMSYIATYKIKGIEQDKYTFRLNSQDIPQGPVGIAPKKIEADTLEETTPAEDTEKPQI